MGSQLTGNERLVCGISGGSNGSPSSMAGRWVSVTVAETILAGLDIPIRQHLHLAGASQAHAHEKVQKRVSR